MAKERLYLFDTTMRDGALTTGVDFSLDDKRRIALSKKVSVTHDPSITNRGSNYRHMVRVDVHLRDGSVESETREAPRGSEHSFATSDEIVDKFRKLTRAGKW